MELFHCITTPRLEESSPKQLSRAKSEERDPVPPPRGLRRPSLPAQSAKKMSSASMKNGFSAHYEKKKSIESLDRLTSRTLSPPPETLPRKFSRSMSVTSASTPARLPRHPELPPLNIELEGPRLKDYLEKPRLVSTNGRRPSQLEEPSVDQLIPGLAQLSSYYNQTFLSSCDTCDSLSHKNPVSVLNNGLTVSNRGMWACATSICLIGMIVTDLSRSVIKVKVMILIPWISVLYRDLLQYSHSSHSNICKALFDCRNHQTKIWTCV